jgi:hypothetical protein
MTSEVGWTKEDMAEVSLEVMVMEQGPASALLTPSVARETVPIGVSQQQGPAAPGSDEESSRALALADDQEAWGGTQIDWANLQNLGAMLFTLDVAT